MNQPGILQNAKGDWSSVRLAKLIVVFMIMLAWVIVCIKDQDLVSFDPSILGLLLICMGIGSIEKYIELISDKPAGKVLRKILRNQDADPHGVPSRQPEPKTSPDL